jgi:dGTPase
MEAGYDDFVRTRLTHSLEVAQIGRDLAWALGCSGDVVEAACLAHDLGHPPFGHNGEQALNEIAKDIGGFEGNAQTLRIISRLEPKVFDADGNSRGLNLTRSTLDATIKYPWTREQAAKHPTGDRSVKFGIYEDDLPVFEWVRSSAPQDARFKKCIEAQVMDLADDISYCVHDVEDAIISNSFEGNSLGILLQESEWKYVLESIAVWYGSKVSEDDLLAARERLRMTGALDAVFDGSLQGAASIKNATSTLIGRFVNSAYASTREAYQDTALTRFNADIVVPEETRMEILLLKGFSTAFVMIPKEEAASHQHEQKVIFDLAEHLMRGKGLETLFVKDFETAASEDAKLRVVADQIASLTDFSAEQKAREFASFF